MLDAAIPQIFQRLLLALAIGLLIGVERGWKDRDVEPGGRAAGIRTHALIGLLGAIFGLLARNLGGAILGFGFLGFAGTFVFFEYREMRLARSVSATGLVGALLAFVLGAYSAVGDMAAAGCAGVAATVILAEREMLHGFLEKLQWSELRAALLLLIMTFVLLPVLPDRTIDPWRALNPHQLWLMAILIASFSYVGYIAVRLWGSEKGLLFAGAAGALVSSTTVTWTFARLAAQGSAAVGAVSAAILSAWAVSLVRMTSVAIIIAPPLLATLGFPMVAGAIVLALAALLFYRRGSHAIAAPLPLGNPFDVGTVLQFTILLAVISVLAAVIGRASTGGMGLPALAFVTGLVDVDPITLSVAKNASASPGYGYAATVIIIAAGANLLAKSCFAVAFGGWQLGVPLAMLALVAAIFGGSVLAILR